MGRAFRRKTDDGIVRPCSHEWVKPYPTYPQAQQIEVKVLKLANEGDKRRISVSMKQLQPHPWDAGAQNYKDRSKYLILWASL